MEESSREDKGGLGKSQVLDVEGGRSYNGTIMAATHSQSPCLDSMAAARGIRPHRPLQPQRQAMK